MQEEQTQHHRIRGTTPAIVAAARRLRLNLGGTKVVESTAKTSTQRPEIPLSTRHRFVHCRFYCPQCRLVIELDGDIHDQQVEYDAARTEYLNQLGYRVIRFRNPDVMHFSKSDMRVSKVLIHRQSPPFWGI